MATALIRSLAWELPCASDVALKRQKDTHTHTHTKECGLDLQGNGGEVMLAGVLGLLCGLWKGKKKSRGSERS